MLVKVFPVVVCAVCRVVCDGATIKTEEFCSCVLLNVCTTAQQYIVGTLGYQRKIKHNI